MSARSFLNVAWAHWCDGIPAERIESMLQLLNEKFEHEMTLPERKRAEAYRRTVMSGGLQGVRSLQGLMTR
jgi:hypothetical protein